MKYAITFTKRAIKQLKKLDKPAVSLIIGWLEKNIEDCDNPRQHGKKLSGDRNDQWRYRIGNYRVICNIQDDKLIVLILEVGHRRNVYIA